MFLERSSNEWRDECNKGRIYVIDIGKSRGRREKTVPLMVVRLHWVRDRQIRHAESLGIEFI